MDEIVQVKEFGGVNDILDEIKLPPEFVPWSHGGYFNERKQLERIKGKLIYPATSTSLGRVLGIHEMTFTNRHILVVHCCSTIFAFDNLVVLRSSTSVLNPMEPFIT